MATKLRLRRLLLVCALTALGSLVGAKSLRAQESGLQKPGKASLLMLVTEKVVGPEGSEEVGYWWSNPTSPEWTGTDEALEEALAKTNARALTPSDDVRISSIYQTPDLSLDNASALSSIVGARRTVVGTVRYERRPVERLAGLGRVDVDGTLQLVDVTSSEPSVVRTIEVERTLFESRAEGDADGEGEADALLERARGRFASVAGALLGRTVAASSGPVGLETRERLLGFHDLKHGRALELLEQFLAELDVVEATRVRWASEGMVAVELNPGGHDDPETVDYATRALASHSFERMSIRRRERAEKTDGLVEFDVELSEDFGERRRDDENEEGDDE